MTIAAAVNGSSPIKRKRRGRAAIDALKSGIVETLREIEPATVRQTFYQLVSRGLIDKTEQQYKGLVRLLSIMRRDGDVPFGWIADNTRWMRKPDTYSSLGQLLKNTAQLYRRSLWDNQDAYVEIWLEKDALSGVLYEITQRVIAKAEASERQWLADLAERGIQ